MARVFTRRGIHYLDFRDELGVRQRLATDATTKGAAGKLLAEKVAQVERIRLGLEAARVKSELTLWELCRWWLTNRCPEASRKREESRLAVNVQRTPLGGLPLESVTEGVLEDHFAGMERAGAAPGAVNRVRAILRAIFNAAAKKSATKGGALWSGRNPVVDTDARPQPKKTHPTLRLEEVPSLLAQVPEQWRGFFATAIYLALRKGEIAGLQKSHVDLRARVLQVAASYETQGTKGRRSEGGGVHELPIEDVLQPYLEEALRTSPSEYLFPGPGGKMRTEDSNPERILRTALKRAGLVDGYTHTCRRCGVERAPGGAKGGTKPNPFASKERHAEHHPDAQTRHCPKCNGRMWAEGKPRGNMRFHDMRHSTATILLRAGAPMYRVQRILRHAQISTTIGTYGHLETQDLRSSLGLFNTPVATPPPSGSAPRRLAIVGTNKAQLENDSPDEGNNV